ncbi:hypothetical protein [Paraburkholderia caledonica]|uniref:Uncharacterized protein n=1 Tax=Paraburkholderia caledonica TaxID=134536 RepID=A0AB73IPJ5_9BURK|nr:hypothetical protein [Paraburkholderia caledonica]
MKREITVPDGWKANCGSVPSGVRLGVRIEAWRRDGTRCISDDYDHRDLWIAEKHGAGHKDIIYWRLAQLH